MPPVRKIVEVLQDHFFGIEAWVDTNREVVGNQGRRGLHDAIPLKR
jgi:hypothetical protein